MRLPGKGYSKNRGARPVYSTYLDDLVDSDQYVVNKELCHFFGLADAEVLCVAADHRDRPPLPPRLLLPPQVYSYIAREREREMAIVRERYGEKERERVCLGERECVCV